MDPEMKRKTVHIFNGVWAFTFAFIPRLIAVLIVLIAFFLVTMIFRPGVFDKAFEAMARQQDYEKGFLIGPTIYIMIVLVVVFLFDFRVAAAAFAMLAFGDGSATVIGKKYGRHKIKTGKTWEGFFAFVTFGFIFTSIAYFFVEIYRKEGKAGWAPISEFIFEKQPDYLLLLCVIFLITIIAGIIELYSDHLIDDNIMVPLTTTLCLSLFLAII